MTALSTSLLVNGLSAQTTKTLTPEMLLSMVRMGDASLSPDGKQVVYSLSFPSIKDNKSRSELFLVGIDGKGRQQITTTTHGEYSPVWIAGGKRIAFMSTESGDMQLWSMLPDGRDKKQLTNLEGGIEGFRVSPDGKQVLLVKQIKYGKRTQDLYPDLDKATGRVINDLMYKHWDEWVETIPHIFVATLGIAPLRQR